MNMNLTKREAFITEYARVKAVVDYCNREAFITEYARVKSVVDYCNLFTLVVSLVGICLTLLNTNKNIIYGISFCIIITFSHFVFYLFRLSKLKDEFERRLK